MHFQILISVIMIITVNSVLSARILGVFPIPSLSHQIVFRRLYLELAKNGHELVVITPNPALLKNETNANIKEIDVGFSYEYIKQKLDAISIFKKKVVADVDTVNFVLYDGFLQMIKEQLRHREVAKIIEDKEQRFDLVIIEAYFSLGLVYSHIFKAPVILISSFHGLPENYDTVGAASGHVTLYPHFNRNKFRDLSFWEMCVEFYYEIKLRIEFWKVENEGNRIIKELFGPDAPTINMLRENVDMLFINSHPIFGDNRPVPPSVLYLGGLHMQPVKALPEDLKHYLDSSKNGVIYVSLGTNVLPSKMDKDMLDNFINAFEKLPYDILWKFDGGCIEFLPKNVKTQEWFPQRDLLMHPNIKAFITQGGLQSTDEAIDGVVPLVGIPILGDQFFNVHKYVELGIGIQLDAITFTDDDLIEAVNEVINTKTYKKNILRLRSTIRDQPLPPLERAVWWVEHVLRHGGARHLRTAAANIPWMQYFKIYLIVIPFTSFLVLAIFVIVIYCLTKIVLNLMPIGVKRWLSCVSSKVRNCLKISVYFKYYIGVYLPKWMGGDAGNAPKPLPRQTEAINGNQAGPKNRSKYNKVRKDIKYKAKSI